MHDAEARVRDRLVVSSSVREDIEAETEKQYSITNNAIGLSYISITISQLKRYIRTLHTDTSPERGYL